VKGTGCVEKKRPLALFHLFKAHVAIMAGKAGDSISREPSRFYQFLQADQQWIAGKGRKGGVRRITVAGRTQGKNLPQPLFRSREKVSESVGGRSEVSNTPVGR